MSTSSLSETSLRLWPSILDYGLHLGCLFIDGIGRSEFVSAHDPVPTAAHAMPPFRPMPGDPFSEPSRPLVLTLASDCQELGDGLRDQLLSLSRFPGVVLVLAPGVSDHGYERP